MATEGDRVVRRWFEEVWNQRRAATVDELLTAASVCHTADGPVTGPAEVRARLYQPLLGAFPDLRVTVEDVIAEGDRVAVRWAASGTHTGHGLGFGPSGRAVTFRGMTWVRVQGGKLVEGWQWSDIPEVVRSLAAPEG